MDSNEPRSARAPPDAAPLLQVLEGVDGPEDLGAFDPTLDHGLDLVEGSPSSGGFGRGQHHEPLTHGDRAGIDDPHRHLVGHGVGRGTGRLVGGGQGAGYVDAHHAVVPFARRGQEGLLERPGGRCRGLGQHVTGLAPTPEFFGGQRRPVHELLGSEADRQGHDRDPPFLGQ